MEKDLLLYLNAIQIGYNESKRIIKQVHTVDELLSKTNSLTDIKQSVKDRIQYASRTFDLNRYKEELWKRKIKVITSDEENYPENLKMIEEKPHLLYYKGTIDPIFNTSIAIVGSRKCTNYGVWAATFIANELSKLGIPIISGLALGIDKIAHKSCLEHNNWTCGVMGCGMDRIYPLSNKTIYDDILRSDRGAILSEYALGTPPIGYNFPWRNRIIAGMSLATIVIEAKKKSGTLITARYAGEFGREVFAIPGNINSIYSEGTNLLIKDGARILQGIEDILEELPILKRLITPEKAEPINLTIDQTRVLQLLEETPKSSEQLSDQLKMDISEVLFTLTELEMMDLILETGDKFCKK